MKQTYLYLWYPLLKDCQYVNIIHHGVCVGIKLENKKWKKTLKINKKRPISKQKATSRQDSRPPLLVK
jgi:hypothetical protein